MRLPPCARNDTGTGVIATLRSQRRMATLPWVARHDNVTMITAFVLGTNCLLLIKSPFLLGDFELHCLQYLIVWADYIHMPVSSLMILDYF